jgi:photosystem II stability/assembly factor-like uncharacterized protein
VSPLLQLLGTALRGSLLTVALPVLAQPWIQTSAPITNWTSVACSADGTRLVAAAGQKQDEPRVGPIFISSDSGVTWTPTSAPITNWSAVASSLDGNNLVATVRDGGIYTSTDSGVTWIPTTAPILNWHAVGSSANGATLVAAGGGPGFPYGPSTPGPIFISHDSGANWTNTDLPEESWTSVAVSADGSKLIAAHAGFGQIFSSSNSGGSWISNFFPHPYLSSIGTSSDGCRLLAVAFDWVHYHLNQNGTAIFSSTNSGVIWEQIASLGPGPHSLAASADGRQWVAAPGVFRGGGSISISSDSGTTWTQTISPSTIWGSVASSADGSKLVAAAYDGGIWICRSTPAPLLRFAPSGTDLSISWIMPSAEFVLQQNLDPTTPNWTAVPTVPTLNLTNVRHEVTMPMSDGNRFYRLKY